MRTPSHGIDAYLLDRHLSSDASEMKAFTERVCQLPGVERVLGLCDFSVNAAEDTADSLVVESKDWLVPALADEEINCGIGLINTGVIANEVSEDAKRSLLQRIWELSCSRMFSLGDREVEAVFLGGAGFLSGLGLITEGDRDAFEFRGALLSSQEASRIDLDALIPRAVRQLPQIKRPARLQATGNHFLELQEVDQVIAPTRLKAMGLQGGELVLMVHTGPRITKLISNHFVTRKKVQSKPLGKRGLYGASKAVFHFARPVGWRSARERWRLYFREAGFVALHVDSDEGRRYLTAYALAANYGYAMRALVYHICQRALEEVFGVAPKRLLVDSSHESIRSRKEAPGAELVSRKGACECIAGRPAIVAGSQNVPSLLGEATGSSEWGFSYDHGSANFRKFLGDSPLLTPEEPAVVEQYVVAAKAPQWQIVRHRQFPVAARPAMEILARRLENQKILQPVALLRPVANLKED